MLVVLAIFAIWFGYKKARDTGRNPILWAVICGAAFIGIQLLVGVGIVALIGVGMAFWGWSDRIFSDYQFVISIISLAPSIVALLLVFRYLDRVPDNSSELGPPPPPRFDQNA